MAECIVKIKAYIANCAVDCICKHILVVEVSALYASVSVILCAIPAPISREMIGYIDFMLVIDRVSLTASVAGECVSIKAVIAPIFALKLIFFIVQVTLSAALADK
jgi:hypothetical protein